MATLRAWQRVALIFALLCAPRAALAESGEALVARARQLDLADSRAWLRLLHFRPTGLDQPESEVNGSGFFLAPDGAHDAEAELAATLRAFLLPVRPGHEDEHALCRFPARRRWLDQQLHFERALHLPRCPSLTRFMGELAPDSVAIVYAANFLSNPASAFGHTFLRIDKRRRTNASARGVEYVANTDTDNPLLYTWKGLTGGFPGVFRYHSFESKVHEYADAEARDLWEYRLSLTPAEAQLLGLHLWELSNTHLDYYYMSKNCSYHALATVEAAAPRIDLVAHLNFVVLPRDTVKALFTRPGLVRSVAFHPSLRSQRRAEAAHSPVPIRPEDIPPPYDKAPERAHGSMRLTLGSGITSQYENAFTTLGYRLALHDLTDPPDGEPELSQLQFLDTRFRYDYARRELTLERLTFAELLALTPITSYERALSWRVRAFGMRLHDRACADCFAHGLNLSLGGTIATENQRLALFALADGFVAFSPSLDGVRGSFVRLGIGPFAGVRARLTQGVVALLTGSVAYLPWQSLRSTYELRATVRGALSKDVAIGLEGAMQPYSRELVLGSYFYF